MARCPSPTTSSWWWASASSSAKGPAGDHRFWLPLTALIFAIQLVVIGGFLSRDPIYARRYPTFAPARAGGRALWIWEGSRVVYFFSWEFLFRGYLLFA